MKQNGVRSAGAGVGVAIVREQRFSVGTGVGVGVGAIVRGAIVTRQQNTVGAGVGVGVTIVKQQISVGAGVGVGVAIVKQQIRVGAGVGVGVAIVKQQTSRIGAGVGVGVGVAIVRQQTSRIAGGVGVGVAIVKQHVESSVPTRNVGAGVGVGVASVKSAGAGVNRYVVVSFVSSVGVGVGVGLATNSSVSDELVNVSKPEFGAGVAVASAVVYVWNPPLKVASVAPVVGVGVGVADASVRRGSNATFDTKLGGGVTTMVGPGVGGGSRPRTPDGGGGSLPIRGSSLVFTSESGRTTIPVLVSTNPPFATPFVPTARCSTTLPTTAPPTCTCTFTSTVVAFGSAGWTCVSRWPRVGFGNVRTSFPSTRATVEPGT